MYEICEVDGSLNRGTLEAFNALDPYFPKLQERHLTDGYWWLVFHEGHEPVAFAGMVEMNPFSGYGYLKRCLTKPDHYGHGLQFRLMCVRETKARQIGWTHLVSECLEENIYSAANFRKAGFDLCEPEQPWAKSSLYWIKRI